MYALNDRYLVVAIVSQNEDVKTISSCASSAKGFQVVLKKRG